MFYRVASRGSRALLTVGLVLAGWPAMAKEEVLAHWDYTGYASTPTAQDAVRIPVAVEILMEPKRTHMRLSVWAHSWNGAVADGARGCARVSFLRAGKTVSAYEACPEEHNPGRGGNSETERQVVKSWSLPSNLSFDDVKIETWNSDHIGGGISFTQIVGAGLSLAQAAISMGSGTPKKP